VLWPYPIDPWPGEPLPAEYDLLIYAKNGHRPGLLEHLAELYPNHIQFHYGQYKRADLIEAARRSRACAYLADDDHGPLALQEILLAGCPTVGVRTGASFVRHEVTGLAVQRLAVGRKCAVHAEELQALQILIESIETAQTMNRTDVRSRACEDFKTDYIVEQVINTLASVRQTRSHTITIRVKSRNHLQ
jgi:glycosyltransferase involved in cell wall biosynthesis